MKINFSIEEFRQMIDAGQSDDIFIQNLITLGVLNNRKQAKIMSKLRETLTNDCKEKSPYFSEGMNRYFILGLPAVLFVVR